MNTQSLLVVEDDADTRILYQQALRSEGYNVTLVGTGTDALAWLAEGNTPSLILMDLTLPGLSGAAFLGRLKEKPAWDAIPVVLVSGQENLKATAQSLGANGSLRKPFDLRKLFETVKQFLAPSASA